MPRRTAVLLAASILDLALGALLLRPDPPVALHPLAPPLTRTSALGDHPLVAPTGTPPPPGALRLMASRIVAAQGTPEQKRQMADLEEQARHMSDFRERGAELRMGIEADAQALATALGPARVSAIVAAKDTLATRYGEGRLWAQAGEALAR